MPSHDIEWGMVLRAFEELSAKLVDNLPRLFLDFVFGNWVQEVSGIGQPVGPQRTKLRELKTRAPDFWIISVLHADAVEQGSFRTQDITPSRSLNIYLEPLPPLNDTNLARLHVQPSKLGLNV